jgi:hypothetical protein
MRRARSVVWICDPPSVSVVASARFGTFYLFTKNQADCYQEQSCWPACSVGLDAFVQLQNVSTTGGVRTTVRLRRADVGQRLSSASGSLRALLRS